ncbi:hypothetical protein HNR42_002746 [Deinobacterium chartae]|uniref:Roadblock/LAMTOR2 domain-containing protein n=1 Tax=Deinobacterium chartae TaxID=521158 RepID=A0A841I4I2_9DEIO|nr:roadblock/LC7 domain-containing protein [Deinobacterium chartae]MBB6099308.1 hypothetical protein [Deinobacterium chartae]
MDVRDILKDVAQIKGITAAAVVSLEGFVIESTSNGDAAVDLDFLGGVASSSATSAQSLIDAFGKGKMNHMMIEFDEGPVLMSTLGDFMLLTTLESAQDLGRVRFQLKKFLPQLSSALQA